MICIFRSPENIRNEEIKIKEETTSQKISQGKSPNKKTEIVILKDEIIEINKKTTSPEDKNQKLTFGDHNKREALSENQKNKSKSQNMKGSKAFSELPKIGLKSPGDFSFLSERTNKSNKNFEVRDDRFSKLPAISEGLIYIFLCLIFFKKKIKQKRRKTIRA